MLNVFKVNNKNIRTTQMTNLFLIFLLLTINKKMLVSHLDGVWKFDVNLFNSDVLLVEVIMTICASQFEEEDQIEEIVCH